MTEPPESRRVRVMTYNIRHCLGIDGVLSPERTASVIKAARPDIVALQELDIRRRRTRRVDQVRFLADELGMDVHFHPARHVRDERFGNAIFTRLPSRLVHQAALPTPPHLQRIEPRSALWVAVDLGGVVLNVVNTHMSLLGRDRVVQARALLGPDWLGHPACGDPNPVLLVGDLNASPRSRAYDLLASHLTDCQKLPAVKRPKRTFPSRFPVIRIDHVFARGAIDVVAIDVPRNGAARLASDHLPVIADLIVGRAESR